MLYTRKVKEQYSHPNELAVIMMYLRDHGDIFGTRKDIEEAYFKFSKDHNCDWLHISDNALAEFEEALYDGKYG